MMKRMSRRLAYNAAIKKHNRRRRSLFATLELADILKQIARLSQGTA